MVRYLTTNGFLKQVPFDTDVLIVGAGPTGLMLANQLARRQVKTLIIDRHAGPAQQSRALGVQARTLEIYSHLGLVEQALTLGKQATGANLRARGRRTARVPLGDIGRELSPYPYLLILGQDDNEDLLSEALAQQGQSIAWNTELVALTQEPTRVIATLKQPDGSLETLAAAWVAGCDGAHSAVRTLNEIPFTGAPYEEVFFVADTTATGSMVPDELNVFLWPRGFHLFFPMRGLNHWRVVGLVPHALQSRADLHFCEVEPMVRREVGSDLTFSACSWFSTYRIHHRCAERFRDGRCFLLGDAAHIHSPVGAQGMNTGLQDAYNLAWKLALVVREQAAPTLLESYSEERQPVARQLVRTTDRAFSLIISDHPLARFLRSRVLANVVALAMRFNAVRQRAFRTVSQIGIHYRGSSLAPAVANWPKVAPQPGDRFPWLQLCLEQDRPRQDLFEVLDDLSFTLLLFGQPASLVGDASFQILSVPDSDENRQALGRVNIPARSFFLLRPDGHIASTGVDYDAGAMADYFSKTLGMRGDAHTGTGSELFPP